MESALLGADRETPGVSAAHNAVHRQANIIGHRAGRCGAACRNATSIGSRSSPPARLCSEPRNNANYKEKCRTPKGFGCIVGYSSITRLGKGPPTGSYNASASSGRSLTLSQQSRTIDGRISVCESHQWRPPRSGRWPSVKKLPSRACRRANRLGTTLRGSSRWIEGLGAGVYVVPDRR
jgi:hypothetical protein